MTTSLKMNSKQFEVFSYRGYYHENGQLLIYIRDKGDIFTHGIPFISEQFKFEADLIRRGAKVHQLKRLSDNKLLLTNNMTQEDKIKLIQAGRSDLVRIYEVNQSGYAGMMPGSGEIVDRRIHPEAIPVPKNDLLGIPEPILEVFRLTKEWQKFPGYYLKEMQDIKLKNGDVILFCWPNAGLWSILIKQEDDKYNSSTGIEIPNSEVEYVRLTHHDRWNKEGSI